MQSDINSIYNALISSVSDLYGWRNVQLRHIQTIKRVYSSVIEVHITASNHEPVDAFIKIYSPIKGTSSDEINRRVEQDFKISGMLYGKMKDDPELSVVRPLVYLPEFMTIVTEKSPGIQFQELLNKSARYYPSKDARTELEKICFNCGRWLKLFQDITCLHYDGALNTDEMLQDYERRTKWLVGSEKIPFDEQQRSKILHYVRSTKEALPPDMLIVSGVHGDFGPGNLLADETNVIVLDFAMYRYGSIYMDLTYFWHQLETLLLKPIFRPSVVTRLQRALLDGYDKSLHEKKPFQTLPLFKIFRIQHLVTRLAGMLPKHPDMSAFKRLYQARVAKLSITQLDDICQL